MNRTKFDEASFTAASLIGIVLGERALGVEPIAVATHHALPACSLHPPEAVRSYSHREVILDFRPVPPSYWSAAYRKPHTPLPPPCSLLILPIAALAYVQIEFGLLLERYWSSRNRQTIMGT